MVSRSEFFDKKLERLGLRVPRGSILVRKGLNAPLIGITPTSDGENRMKRTQSMGPAHTDSNLRFSEIEGVEQEPASSRATMINMEGH